MLLFGNRLLYNKRTASEREWIDEKGYGSKGFGRCRKVGVCSKVMEKFLETGPGNQVVFVGKLKRLINFSKAAAFKKSIKTN
jgi:hypothetical protein